MTEQRPWPATELEIVPIESLVPYSGNARTHSDRQVEVIANLMLRFGITAPVLRDGDGTIIAGHARVRAALLNRARGHERFGMLPVITACGWSEDEKRAYAIADNQSALLAGWNFGMLASEVQALAGAGFDTASLGFSESDLRRMTGYADGLTAPDAAPALTDAVSRSGDLWLLDRHRVLCGDATKGADVQKLLAASKPSLMVTDPPYGVDYDPAWRRAAGVSASARVGKVPNDDRADWREAWALFPGDVAYVWHAGRFAADVQRSLAVAGFDIRAQIMWRKPHFAIGRGDYHWQHEPCWYAVRNDQKSRWSGDRKQSTVWDIAGVAAKGADIETENAASVHGTQKPVECMRRPMENNSHAGDIVYDPFLGSGTTLIAAEQCERICFGLEIDPRYADVIVRRWQDFTGKPANLAGVQKTFREIEEERKNTGNGRERTKAASNQPARHPGQQKQTRASEK